MKEGWEYRPLSELFDITSSKRVFQSEWKTAGVPFYRAREIVQLSKNGYVDNELFITEELYSEYTKKYGKPQVGDIMVTGVGTLGICYLVKTNDKFYFKDGNIIWLKKKTDNISEYVEYAFKSNFVKNQVENSSGATVGTYTIIRANKTIIPIPQSIHTQKQIVEELDLLSSIIEKKKAQLNELDNLAQSLFYEMFGNLYETAFPIKTLIEICEFIKDGTHQTPTYTDDKVNGVKFLSAKDVVSGYINWENIKLIPFELHQELHKRIAPQRNDLLLCKNGTTGICAIVDTDEIFDIYVSLALLRPRKPFCPKYLLYAINNPHTKRQFDESLKGIGVPNLHLGEIKKTKIVFPPLDLQQQFAEKVESIEHQKELIKKSIKEVETLFNSRMDYYFN